MPAPSPYRALQTTGLAGSHDYEHTIKNSYKKWTLRTKSGDGKGKCKFKRY